MRMGCHAMMSRWPWPLTLGHQTTSPIGHLYQIWMNFLMTFLRYRVRKNGAYRWTYERATTHGYHRRTHIIIILLLFTKENSVKQTKELRFPLKPGLISQYLSKIIAVWFIFHIIQPLILQPRVLLYSKRTLGCITICGFETNRKSKSATTPALHSPAEVQSGVTHGE